MSSDDVGEKAKYLQDGLAVILEFHEETPLGLSLPETVSVEVTETEPVVKGQTAASSAKPALLSNGIRTTVIFPGLCDTEILTKRPTPTPCDVLDRALDPLDVAEAVLFVAQLHPRAVVPEMQLLPSGL